MRLLLSKVCVSRQLWCSFWRCVLKTILPAQQAIPLVQRSPRNLPNSNPIHPQKQIVNSNSLERELEALKAIAHGKNN